MWYAATACVIFMPVIFIEVADHNAIGGRGMNEEIVCEVDAHMGYVPAVYMKENKVALFGVAGVFYPFTIAELLYGGAHKVYTINFAIQFLCKTGAINPRYVAAAKPVGGAVPAIYEII